MSANKYQPHALLLPEDDANKDILNGFLLESGINASKLQPLEAAGGWRAVRDVFVHDHIRDMLRFPERLVILLVDFDAHEDRLGKIREVIPSGLSDRVFVLGVWTEPEDLKKLGSLENVGKLLAKDCVEGTRKTWSHELFNHNAEELERLTVRFRASLLLQR